MSVGRTVLVTGLVLYLCGQWPATPARGEGRAENLGQTPPPGFEAMPTPAQAESFVAALEANWPRIQAWAVPRLPRGGGANGLDRLSPEWLLQNWEAMRTAVSGIDRTTAAEGLSAQPWDRTGRAVLRTYMALLREQDATAADRQMAAARDSLLQNPHIPEDQRQRLLQMMQDTQVEMRELQGERPAEMAMVEPLMPRLDRLFPDPGQNGDPGVDSGSDSPVRAVDE